MASAVSAPTRAHAAPPSPMTAGASASGAPSSTSALPNAPLTEPEPTASASSIPRDSSSDNNNNAVPSASTSSAPPLAQPHSFFPMNNHPTKSDESEPIPCEVDVYPEDDPSALRGIPIFRPTMDEFKDFDVYMERVAPWGMRSGIVKVVPPREWVDAVQLVDKHAMSELQIRSPIEQVMLGKNGVFVQRNVERMRNRPLSIREWFDKCAQRDFVTPNPKEIDRTTDRDSREFKEWQREQKEAAAAAKVAKREKRLAAAKRKEERLKKREETEEAGAAKVEPDSSTFHMDEEAEINTVKAEPTTSSEHNTQPAGTTTEHDDVPALENSSVTSHSTPENIATPRSESPALDPFYETVDLKKDWLPAGVNASDFTVRGCANVERKFWKTIGMGRSSWYGADLAGSLFADPKTPWNVATLPNLLRRMKNKLPGVNTPYLYFGMWRAAFSWHVEDMDLFSINYIHFGAPKFWYAVPQADAERFENVTRSYFPNDANLCDQFMRHKACTLSPTRLNQEGIRVNKMVQHQNEFVITFPRGYHAGFNVGFNCAESANFALPCWVEIGKRAKACSCVNYSVRIDVDELLEEPKPELVVEEEPPKPRKRKAADSTPGSARRRRRKVEVAEDGGMEVDQPTPSKEAAEKPMPVQPFRKPAIPISAQPKPAITQPVPTPPCVLCPSHSDVDLAPVFQPSDHIRSLSKTPAVQAHISCAVAVPEVYTEDVDAGDGTTVTYIKGVDNIGKDRWKLKCAACVDARSAKMGTKIQCTKGKCLRAYHVPCARDNEMVHYWAGQKDEQSPFVVELLCPTHNPRMVDEKKARAAEELRQKVMAIPPGAQVKIKKNGSSMAAKLVQVSEVQAKVQVEMPDGAMKEVAWSALDFRPSEVQMQANEYAGPPKRSRKLPMPVAPVTGYVTRPFTQPPPHVLPPGTPPGYTPNAVPNSSTSSGSSSSYHYGPTYPTANHVMLVDSSSSSSSSPYQQHHRGPPQGYHNGYYHGPLPSYPSRAGTATAAPPAHSRPAPAANGGQLVADHRNASNFGPPPPHTAWSHHHHSPAPPLPRPQVQGYSASRPPPTAMAPSSNASASSSSGAPSHPDKRQNASNGSRPSHSHGQPAMSDEPVVPPGRPVGGYVKLGLERMQGLMEGLPALRIPAIHLAGTNGKGSVSALLESCLMQAGFRVLRYNSPFLVEPRDAVRINGELAPADEYAAAVAEVDRVRRERRVPALPFELTTAAAYVVAARAQPPIDIMVIECGMGGVRDCTNVLPPDLTLASVLTTVGLDHTDRIGSTIAEIATEKAGIAVRGGLLILGPHIPPDAMAVAQRISSDRSVALIQAQPGTVVSPATPVSLKPFRAPEAAVVRVPLANRVFEARQALPGAHQADNLALAITILDVLRQDARARSIVPRLASLSDAQIASGVARTAWAGRCSWLEVDVPSPRGVARIPLLADGAHNADSADTLRDYIESLRLPPGRRTYLLSLSHNTTKPPESVLSPLLRKGDRVALMDFTTPVAEMPWIYVAPREPVREAVRALLGPEGELYEPKGMGPEAVMDGLTWASKGWAEGPGLIVLAGSLYFVADLYRIVQAQAARPGASAKA